MYHAEISYSIDIYDFYINKISHKDVFMSYLKS